MSARAGSKDGQTVTPEGGRVRPPSIAGVVVHPLANVISRSGYVSEIFRTDWAPIQTAVRQVNWAQMNPGAITDWHVHYHQTDHLIGVGGNIKVALYDGREDSATFGASEVVRFGAIRPVMVIVPPGVWHGLRNESGAPAGYVNVIDRGYNHADPDDWRVPSDGTELPDIL